MTRRYSSIDWRDVFYNSVRKASGGVAAAAAYLTDRREKSIHREDLRRRLRGADGESLTLEMAELLTEWMQEIREPGWRDWLKALNSQFGLVTMELPPPPAGGWACEASAIREKALQLNVQGGQLTELVMKATDDKRISKAEAEAIEQQAMAEIELLYRTVRNARRAAGLEVSP